MAFLAQLLIAGTAVGSLYALVALAFVLIFKATRVLNFAQGELMMVGAYLGYTLLATGWPYGWAFLAAVAGTAVVGLLCERLFLRRMIGKPLFSIIMLTIGLSIMLRGIVGLVWGHDTHAVPNPFTGRLQLGPVVLSYVNLFSIAVSVALLIGFLTFFRYSKMGLGMRATASHQDTAMLMGVRVRQVFNLSWGISAAVSVFAGMALANINFVHPDMGSFAFRAFPAIILGGLDSVQGAILGGVLMGIIENLAGGYLDSLLGGGIKEITAYVLLLFILIVRPYGFFGTREVERV